MRSLLLQALSLVSLVGLATDSAVSAGQNVVEAKRFQRSILQAVGGLAQSHPFAFPEATTSPNLTKAHSACLQSDSILRPASAAAPEPIDALPDASLLSRASPLPRPKTSPAGRSHQPPDVADILRMEHLPEWQSLVAASLKPAHTGISETPGDSSATSKPKPGKAIAPQSKWRVAGAVAGARNTFASGQAARAKKSKAAAAGDPSTVVRS
jgi:hypothetical protein